MHATVRCGGGVRGGGYAMASYTAQPLLPMSIGAMQAGISHKARLIVCGPHCMHACVYVRIKNTCGYAGLAGDSSGESLLSVHATMMASDRLSVHADGAAAVACGAGWLAGWLGWLARDRCTRGWISE